MIVTYYPRPDILARPELKQGHAVIEASAGTGKTFTLEHLVLDLIIRDKAKIEEILVVTFTEAATRELRERVRTLIRQVCDERNSSKPGDCADAYWEIDDTVRGRLREALFRFDGAAISTIHGFCQRILSEQAFLGGQLFEQVHTDGEELFGLAFREEIRTVLIENGPVGEALRLWVEEDNPLSDLQKILYECHREGVPDRCPLTPRWDPEGFFNAIDNLPSRDNLLKAGRDLFSDNRNFKAYEKHIVTLFETTNIIQTISNPHKAGLLFMEWSIKEATLDKVKNSRMENLHRVARHNAAPPILQELSGGLNEIALLAAPEGSLFAYELLPRVQNRLATRKGALGLIDYDDMLLGVLGALKGKGAEVLLNTLRKRWKFALVDEFQDTDPIQWEIFRILFVDGTNYHRLLVIGDPKQAIYSFRGADVHTYKKAREHLTRDCSASRLPLTKNFRSTEPLIKAVNLILTISDDHDNTFFNGLNRYDEPVECGNRSRTAQIAGKPAVPVQLIHLFGKGNNLSAGSIKKNLGCFIGEEIHRLTSKTENLETGSTENKTQPIKLSDIYILTRTGREGIEIGEALRSYGIPHAFYKQDGLFNTGQAEDIYRLLCAIDSPADHAARMSAWLTPFFGVALSELPNWQEAGESHPLVALLLEWKRQANAQAWSNLFDNIVTDSGLARRLIFNGAERDLTNYLHLFEVIQAEAHANPVTLGELARSLKARIDGRKLPEGREGDVQRLETDKEAVQILTMHKAKGLEAEVIFIGGGFGSFPGGKNKIKIYHDHNQRCLHIGEAAGNISAAITREEDEENQRLLYVAITRAKSRLYLPYFGGGTENTPGNRTYGYSHLGKFYKILQKQLDLIRKDILPANRDLFMLREADCRQQLPREYNVETPAMQSWPEAGLVEPPPSSAGQAKEIAVGRLGMLLTSYTRMSRGKSWQAPTADPDDQASRRDEEVAAEVAAGLDFPEGETTTDETPELPCGKEAGIFLHTLLECTPLDEIQNYRFEEWAVRGNNQERVKAIARQHGFTEQYLPYSLRLVYRALRTPVHIESREEKSVLDLPGGFASGSRHCAEMSFIYPIPEIFHPLLISSSAAAKELDRLPFEAQRGYLQGLIDLVFEHNHKIFILDWKSDCLPLYNHDALDAHVESNYTLQVRVYTLAVIRLLGINAEEDYEAKFGGVLYVFIRGIRSCNMEQQNTGIWFSRPSWTEVTTWECDFVSHSEWGE